MKVQYLNQQLQHATSEMGVLIREVVEAVVTYPERVMVSEIMGTRSYFEVIVHPDDVGVVLGRRGVLIDALREVMSAAGVCRGFRAIIEIVNPGNEGRRTTSSPKRLATEQELEAVRSLIERLVRFIVDDPAQTTVHLTRGREYVMYEIEVPHAAALRQTIGRKGVHISALRVLCDAMLGKLRQVGSLHLMEVNFQVKGAA